VWSAEKTPAISAIARTRIDLHVFLFEI